MPILTRGGNEPVEHGWQVVLEAWLEFDGPQGRGTADVAECGDSPNDARFLNDLLQLVGQVVHVAVAAGLSLHVLLKDHQEGSGTVRSAVEKPVTKEARHEPIWSQVIPSCPSHQAASGLERLALDFARSQRAHWTLWHGCRTIAF